MKQKELFSVILLHYNQQKYIKIALDSIFYQSYSEIEIIICDDGSDLNKKEIEDYIKKNMKKNIKSVKYILLKKNIGTVKITNQALKEISGKYVLIFAADDQLYDKNVLQNFVKEFNDNPEQDIITSQCILYDSKLKQILQNYVPDQDALELNKKTALEQYKKLAFVCLYAAGGTAYKTKVFENCGLINEEYSIVEDLSFWLSLTRRGVKIYYKPFIGLKHRDGGVSKSDDLNFVSDSQKKYYFDILKIKEKEIIPYINYFLFFEKVKILDEYLNFISFCEKRMPEEITLLKNKKKKVMLKHPFYLIVKFSRKILEVLKCFNDQKLNLVLTCLLWTLFNFISYFFNIGSYLLIMIFINYFIASVFYKLIKRWYKNGKK